MRFLLPIVSACLLANSGQAYAQGADAAAKPAGTPEAVKIKPNKPASFFLEEITAAPLKISPAKPAAKTTAKPAATTAAATTTAKPAAAAAAKKDASNPLLQKSAKTSLSKHFEQGVMMQSMGMAAHAITEYRDALKEDPKYVSTYNNLAQCLVTRNEEGDRAEALKLLAEARRLEPNNVGTLHAIGVLKEDEKDFDGAIEAYRKVLQIQPLNMRTIQNLSELYFRHGDKAGARAVIEEAIKQGPPEQQKQFLTEALTNLAKATPKQTAEKTSSSSN